MKVLIDTSAWIHSFNSKAPYFGDVHALSVNEESLRHELVYGELLIGDVGGRARFLADYQLLPGAATIAHEEVVFLARTRKLHGRGLSWIDVHLLASALAGGFKLYTADEALADAAAELGVAYSPKSSR